MKTAVNPASPPLLYDQRVCCSNHVLRVHVTSLRTHLGKWYLAVMGGTRDLVGLARLERQRVHLFYLYKGVKQGQGGGDERSLGSEWLRSNPVVIQQH